MSSIFSTQNLQTFLRRKNFRPPPPSRGGPPGPRPPPPPPNRGRSPLGRSPPDRGPSLERGLSLGADCSGAFVSSAIILLESLPSARCRLVPARGSSRSLLFLGILGGQKPLTAEFAETAAKHAEKCGNRP